LFISITSKAKFSPLVGSAWSRKKFWHNRRVGVWIGVDEVAKAAVEYGADEVLVADDASLLDYRAETYASTLSALASSSTPEPDSVPDNDSRPVNLPPCLPWI
jgi:electron transfer flavoprotein alpha subunit